jgi:hypothetical protein
MSGVVNDLISLRHTRLVAARCRSGLLFVMVPMFSSLTLFWTTENVQQYGEST